MRTVSPESLANWMPKIPVAVLPPLIRMGLGVDSGLVGRGSFRNWYSPWPTVVMPTPRVAASSKLTLSGMFSCTSGSART